MSWEHCYLKFGDIINNKANKKPNEETIDYLSLQLAFYLASWGMYRGSSFILHKDYKMHAKAVKEILKHCDLYAIEISEFLKNDKKVEEIDKLFNKLKAMYADVRCDVIENKRIKSKKSKDVSETLITKILLGTLGCVPAFDIYLKKGLKKENIKKRYSKETLRSLVEFYNKNKQQFEKFRKNQCCKKQKKLYPPMKIIDMYFWNIGKK